LEVAFTANLRLAEPTGAVAKPRMSSLHDQRTQRYHHSMGVSAGRFRGALMERPEPIELSSDELASVIHSRPSALTVY